MGCQETEQRPMTYRITLLYCTGAQCPIWIAYSGGSRISQKRGVSTAKVRAPNYYFGKFSFFKSVQRFILHFNECKYKNTVKLQNPKLLRFLETQLRTCFQSMCPKFNHHNFIKCPVSNDMYLVMYIVACITQES